MVPATALVEHVILPHHNFLPVAREHKPADGVIPSIVFHESAPLIPEKKLPLSTERVRRRNGIFAD